MKKFSKLLVLLLAVIVIMTAFTVTILATEGETEAPQNREHGTYSLSSTLENMDAGASVDNGHHITRYGYMSVGLGEDGANKYLVSVPSNLKNLDGTGNNYWMWDPAIDRTTTTTSSGAKTYKYNLKDYPYVVLDFDTCSPTGTFGSYNLYNFYFRSGLNGGTSGNYFLSYNFTDFSSFIDQSPYNWQHVTIVARFEYGIDEIDGTMNSAQFVVDYYVNGKNVKSTTKEMTSTTHFIGQKPESAGFYAMRFGNMVGKNVTNKAAGTSAIEGYDWSTYVYNDVTTWPGYNAEDGTYTDPTLWYKEQAALDNIDINHYQSGWTSAEIAADLFNEKTYEFPFGVATAKVGDVLYDNIDEAITAAEAGATVQLLTDIADVVTVEKAIVIDTNKYDAEGKATGEYYKFESTSQNFRPNEEDGKLTFVDAGEMKVQIFWDMCMTCNCEDSANHDEDCTCTCELSVPGHIMYAESSAVLGTSPTYPGQIPTFEFKDGVRTEFLGWSRTLGGEAEEIVITDADVEEKFLVLYPVYEVNVYAFEVSKEGTETQYYTEDEFVAVIENYAPSGSTITLLRDVEINDRAAKVPSSVTLTIDLNGFDFTKTGYNGTTYLYENGDTTDTVLSTESGNSGNIFSLGDSAGSHGKNCVLTLTNSKYETDESTVYLYSVDRDVWVNEKGEIVKFVANGKPKNTILFSNYSNQTTNAYHITVYATQFFGTGHRALRLNGTFEDCNLYRTESGSTSNPAFYLGSDNSNGGSVLVKDCFIYSTQASYFFRTDNSSAPNVNGTKITFENCDFYVTHKDSHNQLKSGSTMQKLINCRYWGAYYNSTYAGEFSEGSLIKIKDGDDSNSLDKIIAALPEGLALQATTETRLYTVPNAATSPLGENGAPTFDFGTKDVTVAFEYKVVKAVAVKWMNGDALVDTTYVAVGETAVGPEISYVIENDYYRNGKYLWVDADGNANLTITDATKEYVFYAAETVNGERDYVASIKGAQMNLNYLTQFHIILYLPVVEGMDAPTIDKCSTGPSKVFINGQEYWAYTWWTGTTQVFDNHKCNISYTVDGKSFTKSIPNISGLFYANLVLSNEDYAAEHDSVANMVRYVREALEAKEITTYDEEIVKLIGTANADGSTTGGLHSLPAYTTEYPDTEYNDWSSLSEYVSAIGYAMSGSNVQLYFQLTEKAKTDDIRMSLTCRGVNPGVYTNADANGNPQIWDVWTTHNVKVYYIIHPAKIEITKVNPETGVREVVAEAVYSIGSYIEANPDVEIAKALYAFGASAEAYNKYVSENS